MGDHMAVEIAQQSHWNLLQQEAGALRPHEVACHRRPLPRGETIEMLSIDDHITLQKVPLRAVHNVWRARDDEIFEAAAPAYEQAGLVQHPDKRRRHIYQGTFLGAELDGIQGRISAPRHRLGVLMLLTSIVCFKGCASPALLSCIVGLWIHVLMFRRPGLAIMDSIFKDAQRTPRDFVVKLCQNILCELQALVWLCPLFQTNLRTEYAPMLFCTDASPFGAGICGADLPENVLRELWRHGEQRGYYTKLEDPASAALRELGLDAVPAFGSESSAPRIPGPTCSVPRSLREGFLFDAVEVFGSDSSWSSAHSDVGLRMHSGHFGKGDRRLFEDLEDPSVFRELAGLAMRRAVFGREPSVGERVSTFSSIYPLPLTKKIAVGSRQALDGSSEVIPLSLRLASLQGLSCGSNFFGSTTSQGGFDCSFESRPFYDDPEWIGELGDALQFRELIRYKFAKGGHINVLETRAYKTWLKWCAKRFRSDGPSRWTSVPAPTKEWPLWLLDLVAGDTHRFDVAVAASAVPKLAARWLRLLLLLGGDIEPHPGPPRDALLRPRGPLDLRSGFASSTQAKMRKAYSAFVLWLTEVMHLTARDVLASHETASLALRAFGLYLYESGHPRYLLVYAITAVQDAFPAYRSKLTPAWQIDKKWQLAEPGECRPVISQPILQAAVSIALLWGWQDWAAITIIGFLCMLHPSEFVFLTRGDLVFPSDALSSDRVAYVHLRHPKTARFARRQHCRLEDQVSLLFLEHLYLERPWDERLFRGSLNVYRSQWNAIMTRLEVPHTLDVKGATPGVLRGSGATFLYLETEDIALVGWRGRWAKTKTIEFYLQEVGAQLLLQRLPAAARRRIALLRDHSRALLLSFCLDESELITSAPLLLGPGGFLELACLAGIGTPSPTWRIMGLRVP
eukprot:s2811_g3.t1